MSTLRPPVAVPWGFSIGLHALLVAALASGLVLPRASQPPVPLTIEATLVDQLLIDALAVQRQGDDQRRRQQQERERAEAEVVQRQQEAEQAQEQERQAQLRRQAEDAKRKADAAEQAKRREAADKRKAEQAAKERADAEARRAREEAQARAAREADLRNRLAAEERRTSAEAGGLKAQYIAAIQAHVEKRWFKPPGMRPETRCKVNVTQIPGGEVVDMRIASCNANDAVRQSILAAIRNASPLPSPPDPALFDRQVELSFSGEE